MLLSMMQPQPQPSSTAPESVPVEISSTTDALAQMRLKRREDATGSSGSKATKAPTLHELEAEAAPLEEAPEEAIPEIRGVAGMIFVFVLFSYFNCLSFPFLWVC